MIDPTLRFSTRVENYIKYRPRYPHEIIETLQKECGLVPSSVIADIGSGTGALTELFLQNGNRVYAVEPNREMREGAERVLRRYPGFHSTEGKAEATTLKDRSIDFAVVGQAFHWFEVEKARREFMRVLIPSGWAMVTWNEREFETTPFMMAYDSLLKRHAPEYARERHRRVYDTALDTFFGHAGFTTKRFSYQQQLDFEGVKGRMLSSSYTPEPGNPNHEPMMAELSNVFERHSAGGLVTLRYITWVYYSHFS